MKADLVFGGQGSQYTGMGRKVYNNSQKARETAFKLVDARAKAMEDSIEDGIGKMAAVINLNIEQVEEICHSMGNNKATIANYNSYKQLVISLAADIYDDFTGILSR